VTQMPLIGAAAAVIVLGLVLAAEKKGHTPAKAALKGLLSIGFVVTALVQPQAMAAYRWWLIPGFICCLAGDVLLALPAAKAFRLGLFAFLTGHVFYTIGFAAVAQINAATWIGAALVSAAGLIVFGWLKPHLGPMTVPVLAYIVVISTMVVAAATLMGTAALTHQGRTLAFAGAVLFYLSDLCVARHRFVTEAFANRLAGLPLYYGGQFLIALSIGALN